MARLAGLLALAAGLIIGTTTLTACGKSNPATDQVSDANIEAGKAYLAKTEKEKGVIKLPSGLMYKILTPATDAKAPKPKASDTVKIHYEGRLIDGTIFDSSFERGVPAALPLQSLIQAWKIALPQMKKGETWELYVPYELGYGATGDGNIPPHSTLIFKIELIDIQPK
jgi:FKBP-type peptidyl-prolyl cis-trans isomerase